MSNKEKIANRIKHLRMLNNWTQEALAYNSGVSQSTLSDIENGKCDITMPTTEKLCKTFNMTLSQFFDYNFTPKSNFSALVNELIFECNYLEEKSIKNLIGFAKVMKK